MTEAMPVPAKIRYYFLTTPDISAIVFSRSHSFWERFFFLDEQITFLGVRHGLVCVPQ